MPILGISVAPSGHKGRPRLSGVLLDGTQAVPVVVTVFDVIAAEDVEAEQIVGVAAGLSSKISGLSFDEAVVRVAGQSGVANRRAKPVLRAQLEGGAIVVLRSHLEVPVLLRDGAQVADVLGQPSTAAGTATGKRIAPKCPEAAAAALSGLPH